MTELGGDGPIGPRPAACAAGSVEGTGDQGAGHRITWTLALHDGGPPLVLMAPSSYEGGFPKAKALVPRPASRFDGELTVDGERIAIDGWLGSQNHNWGRAHTDRYVWGQVAGFDGHDDAFLECSSAKLRIGPVQTPWLTLVVLRLGDEELTFNSLPRSPLTAHPRPRRWPALVSQRREHHRALPRVDLGRARRLRQADLSQSAGGYEDLLELEDRVVRADAAALRPADADALGAEPRPVRAARFARPDGSADRHTPPR